MLGTTARIRRALARIIGTAIVGIPMELLYLQVWRMNTDVFRNELPVLIALPLAAGLGAAIGLELATARPAQTAARTSAWDRSIDLASLILLGILCGGLVDALINERAADSMVDTSIALASLVFGIAAARTLVRWGVYDASAKRIAPFCAGLGLLYGVSMIAGATLVFAITWRTCPPHGWCLEPPSWPSYMLTTGLYIGLPVGIWLALVLWLALLLGRRAASQQPAPLAP